MMFYGVFNSPLRIQWHAAKLEKQLCKCEEKERRAKVQSVYTLMNHKTVSWH